MIQTSNNSNIQPETSTSIETTKSVASTVQQNQLKNICNESNTNEKQIEDETTEEKITKNEFQCKTCSDKFSNLQKCLTHELTTHICATEQPGGKSQNSGRKRKNKSKNLPLSEKTSLDIELRNIVTSTLSECSENLVLQQFCLLFQPSPDNLNFVYQKIYDDLKFELNKRGNWEIHPFGSTINAMALKTSDMDFYINCISGINKKNLPTKKKLFYQVKEALSNSNLFSNVIPVPRARVPVIKCKNNFTGINLDINLSSRIGVYNSIFIGKVINSDNKIHSILLVIKVWAKLWEITKTGRITNYCLTLLVFFYLQNCEPPILPPIKEFQQNCEEFIDNFNFGYEQPKNFNKYANKENVYELLRGFFKFYKNYNYDNFIICPYLGISIEKKIFKEKKFIFPEYEQQILNYKNQFNKPSDSEENSNNIDKNEKQISLKLDSPVVIQDPFCLTLNKFNTGPHIFAHFQNRLEIADKIFTDNNNCSFGNILIKLLYETVSIQKEISLSNSSIYAKKKLNSTIIPKSNLTVDTNNYLSEFNLPSTNSCIIKPLEAELAFIRNYLRTKYPDKTIDGNEIKKNWCENIIKYLIEILEKVYGIDIKVITNENIKKSPKNHGQSDIHSNDIFTKICKITSNLNLWSGRKTINTKRGYAIYLEKTLETTKILENQRKLNSLFQTHLNCELIFRTEHDYTSVKIEMINLDGKIGKQSFKTLFHEFTTNSRNTIIAYFEKLTRDNN